jgi:cobalt-zinc-cadmium efflux system membrane fusion protein
MVEMQAVEEVESSTVESTIESTGRTPATARSSQKTNKVSKRIIACGIVLSAILLAMLIWLVDARVKSTTRQAEETSVTQEASENDRPNLIRIADQQLQSVKLELVAMQPFRAEKTATGKISFNEEVMTPVFSPYAGRIVRLSAKPGDAVKRGATLFEIDTPDLVQAEQDLISAGIAASRANSGLALASKAEDRQHRLYINKAVALKDWEQAEADSKNAERDVHSAQSALAAARSRLHAFGKTDQEIAKVENDREIDRVARVASPFAGTIVARKVGPGQFVKPDSPDPLFSIADLSTVWLLADVYESDVPLIKNGQPVQVHVSAYPEESFDAHVEYIGATVDPATHRVAVRSVVENRGHKLKPEMFASFRLLTASEVQALAVPVSAIVHDGGKTSVWVKQSGNQFGRREVAVGLEQAGYVQILSGLQAGDEIVSEGSIFISNIASS